MPLQIVGEVAPEHPFKVFLPGGRQVLPGMRAGQAPDVPPVEQPGGFERPVPLDEAFSNLRAEGTRLPVRRQPQDLPLVPVGDEPQRLGDLGVEHPHRVGKADRMDPLDGPRLPQAESGGQAAPVGVHRQDEGPREAGGVIGGGGVRLVVLDAAQLPLQSPPQQPGLELAVITAMVADRLPRPAAEVIKMSQAGAGMARPR